MRGLPMTVPTSELIKALRGAGYDVDANSLRSWIVTGAIKAPETIKGSPRRWTLADGQKVADFAASKGRIDVVAVVCRALNLSRDSVLSMPGDSLRESVSYALVVDADKHEARKLLHLIETKALTND